MRGEHRAVGKLFEFAELGPAGLADEFEAKLLPKLPSMDAQSHVQPPVRVRTARDSAQRGALWRSEKSCPRVCPCFPDKGYYRWRKFKDALESFASTRGKKVF